MQIKQEFEFCFLLCCLQRVMSAKIMMVFQVLLKYFSNIFSFYSRYRFIIFCMANPQSELQNKINHNTQIDEEFFLRQGDWIIFNYQSYNLFSQGFKTPELSLVLTAESSIISSIFVVQSYGRVKTSKLVFYGEKVLFQHLLSGKYLSYSHHSSQEEVRLKYGKTGNCLFTIKPIFKCQASFGRKIRMGQQICLQSIDKLRLYIQLGNKFQDGIECIVSMRKHQSSILLVDRINSIDQTQGKITNLLVYQLLNIEKQCALQAYKGQNNHFQVSFSKNINIYGSFIIIQLVFHDTSHKQTVIQFTTQVFIKFYTSSLYLGFDQNRKVQLCSQKNQNCIFSFQDYDKNQLKENSTIRIKHSKNLLYLSVNKDQLQLKPFSLINTFYLKKSQHNLLKITLLVNQIYESFNFLLRENILNNRQKFEILLRQLIKFIFPQSFNQQNYFKMNEIIKLKINLSQQILLAKVGFISLIAQTISELISVLTLDSSEGKSFYIQCISYMMLILLGICYKNSQNTEILIKFLPIIYEGIAFNCGIIESLYYLFSDNSNLRLFQKADHRIKRVKIRSIQILIDHLNKQLNWEVHVKQKLFKLLQKLIKPKGQEKLLLHQFSLIRALKQNRLDKIWSETKIIDQDIYVRVDDEFIQLQGLFQKKVKYNKQIDLIRAQFHFLCTLYSNPNTSNLIYFRNIFPQVSLLNYLKTKIFAQQRRILIRILCQIYLKPLVLPHNFLINIQNNQQIQNIDRFRDYDFRVLEKIRDQIIETLKQGIINQIVDEALYMYIKAVRMFYELNMIVQQDWFRIQELLQNYLLKNYNLVDKYKEVKKLASEIIRSHQFSQEIAIYKYTKILIKLISNEQNNKKPLNDCILAEKALSSILNQSFFSREQIRFTFLNNLIQYTLQRDSQIFVKSCTLMKRISQRGYLLLEKLKMAIIIDNEWYQNIVLQAKQLHEQLKNLLMEYRKLHSQQQSLTGINMSICKKMLQIKGLLYRRQKIPQLSSISALMQNILRQLNIHETIMIFLRDNQRQLRDKSNHCIFFELFDFLLHFFYSNFTNLNICIKQFRLIRWLFTYQSVGQSKILYLLTSDPHSLQVLTKDLKQTALLCIKLSKVPNCYGIMSLILLMINKGKTDIPFINFVAQQIINDQNFIQIIWKINEFGEFSFQLENKQEQNYYQQFGYYLFFVVKLFMVIFQYSSHQKQIISLLKIKLPFKNILKLFIWKDYLDQNQTQYFGSYLLKGQIVKYCEKIYDFEQITQTQLKSYKDICFIFAGKLSSCRVVNELAYPDLSIVKNIFELQIQSQKVKNDYNPITIQQNFHLVIITVFYPFLLQATKKLYQNSQILEQKQEIQLVWLKSYRKVKQLMTMLPKSTYRTNLKRYNRAIIFIEDIIKYKINFELEQLEQQQLSFKNFDYQQQERIYYDQRLHNIAENCRILTQDGNHKNAIKVYKTILILMYSPQISKMLQECNQVIKPLQDVQALMKIIQTISRVFDEDLLQSSEASELIWLFIRKNQSIIDLICQIDAEYPRHFIKFIVKDNQKDRFGKTLGKCLQIYNYTINKFSASRQVLNSNIFEKTYQYTDAHGEVHDFYSLLFGKLKDIIKGQILIYSKSSFESYLQYYESMNSKLNYQQLYQGFHINQALKYISNHLQIISDRSIYSSLVLQVLLLLKTYVKFLLDFNLMYVPKQLLEKIILCLNIVNHGTSQTDEKIITIMHDENYHRQFQVLLRLRDNWQTCQMQNSKTVCERMRNTAKSLSGWQSQWLYRASNICQLSYQAYGPEITYDWAQFPVQAAKCLYGPLKKSLLEILKTLKRCNFSLGHQILFELSTDVLTENIIDIYYKHYHIFGKYTISSTNPDLIAYKSETMKELASTICFQNGIDLVSLLMFIGSRHSKGELQQKYIKYRQYMQSYGGFAADIMSFFYDFRLLLISSHQRLIQKNKIDKIYEYFYQKMARVELLQNGQLYSIDFLIRPQCLMHRAVRSEFISSINFISTQVKLQSILSQCQILSISFDCFINFLITFRKLSFIIFIEKYLSLIRSLNLLFLFISNFYLLMNSDRNQTSFYSTFNIRQTFQIILIVNLLLTVIFVSVYNIRNIPIIATKVLVKLQKQGVLHEYSPSQIRWVIFKQIITNRWIVYHTIFLTLLCLAIYNKLFVALLLLDLLIQIKRMKRLLQILWNAKSQLIYTFISFVLLHYFYTIAVFLIYRQRANQTFCDDFGDCYGFVYNLCFKLIGGFVGYIYKVNYQKINYKSSFHFFDVLQDFYLLMTYEVFIAVIMVIIIDQYSKSKLKSAQLRQILSHNCIICGLSRTVFNTSTLGNFRTHISSQHNVWNYIYFYQYLNAKPIRQRNRLQNMIVMKHTIQWLPNGYAKGFQQPSLNLS